MQFDAFKIKISAFDRNKSGPKTKIPAINTEKIVLLLQKYLI